MHYYKLDIYLSILNITFTFNFTFTNKRSKLLKQLSALLCPLFPRIADISSIFLSRYRLQSKLKTINFLSHLVLSPVNWIQISVIAVSFMIVIVLKFTSIWDFGKPLCSSKWNFAYFSTSLIGVISMCHIIRNMVLWLGTK